MKKPTMFFTVLSIWTSPKPPTSLWRLSIKSWTVVASRWGGLPAFYSDGTRTNFSRSQTVSEDWTYWNSETKAAYLDFKQYVYNDISLNLAYSYRKLYSETSLLYFGGTVDAASGVGEGYVYRYANDALTNEQNIDLYVSASV